MTNRIDESKEWTEAGLMLTELIRSKLSKGSIGIMEYTRETKPLWDRYNTGERSDDLLNDITKQYKKETAQ